MIFKIRPNLLLLPSMFMAIVVHGNVYTEFPQWDSIPWIVKSTEQVELPCVHPKYYPFNDIVKYAEKVQWILPKPTSYLHLSPGTINEGWKVQSKDQNYTLLIDKTRMNVKDVVNGMYVCAALAKSDLVGEDGVYAWYYLRWGVGLYSNVPAMKEGTVGEKYYWCFTYAWVSCLVAITIIVAFAVTAHFHKKDSPDTSVVDMDTDIDSVNLSYVQDLSLSSNRRAKIDEDGDYGKRQLVIK
ncbi:hypothetical protein Aperf_G00000079564 [Anoplocephala perfoliata]